jgi:hypothetical protein
MVARDLSSKVADNRSLRFSGSFASVTLQHYALQGNKHPHSDSQPTRPRDKSYRLPCLPLADSPRWCCTEASLAAQRHSSSSLESHHPHSEAHLTEWLPILPDWHVYLSATEGCWSHLPRQFSPIQFPLHKANFGKTAAEHQRLNHDPTYCNGHIDTSNAVRGREAGAPCLLATENSSPCFVGPNN